MLKVDYVSSLTGSVNVICFLYWVHNYNDSNNNNDKDDDDNDIIIIIVSKR